MRDLTSRTPEEINELIIKYMSFLEFVEDKQQVPMFAIVFDIGINYIKINYNNISPTIKAWAIFVVKKLYEKLTYSKYNIKKDDDIHAIIKEFINYYTQKHEETIKDIEWFASEFDRDYRFVLDFINKKVG